MEILQKCILRVHITSSWGGGGGSNTLVVQKQNACYTGITRGAGADSFIPTVCFAD